MLSAASHRRQALLLLAMAVAMGLRLPGLGLEELASDEAFSWRLVQFPLGEMLRRLAADVHPPLHYLLLKAWTLVAGDSLVSMRALSLGLLALTVPAVFLLTRASLGDGGAGPLLAAGLVALHPALLWPGRSARMYALGVLLSAVSAWLLVRALAAPRVMARWLAWGVSAGAFGLTHYYALFSLAAQGLVVMIEAARRRAAPAESVALVRGGLAGAAAALALFSPWLPVFVRQVRTVQADYWIPALSAEPAAAGLAAWSLGGTRHGNALYVWLALAGAALVVGAWRGGNAARLLLVQALVPWLLAALVSVVGGRPLLLDRYLVFALVPLLAFWGVAFTRLGGGLRVALAGLLGAGLLPPLATAVAAYADTPTAEAQAAGAAALAAGPRDTVLTDSARALNRLKLLMREAGDIRVQAHCLEDPESALPAHYGHTPALAAGDMLRPAQLLAESAGRVLWVAGTRPRPGLLPGWRLGEIRSFRGARGTRHLVAELLPVRAP